MSTLPRAAHEYQAPQDEYSNFRLTDTWVFEDMANQRTYRLSTRPMFQATVPDPVVTTDDLGLRLEVEYENPVYGSETQVTQIDGAALYTPWEPTQEDDP